MATYRRCRNCNNEEEKATLYQCDKGHVYCEECSGGSTFFGNPKCPKCDDSGSIRGFIEREDEPNDDDSDGSDNDTSDYEEKEAFDFIPSVSRGVKSHGWIIAEANEKFISFDARLSDGQKDRVWIYLRKSSLEFTVRSKFRYPSDERIPASLPVVLLRRNSKKSYSFWCIETIKDETVFEVMRSELISEFTAKRLFDVVEGLIEERIKGEALN